MKEKKSEDSALLIWQGKARQGKARHGKAKQSKSKERKEKKGTKL